MNVPTEALAKNFDRCFLSAANESQAKIFRFQLDRLLRAGFLSADTELIVVPDKNGKRIGSGGATLGILRKFSDRLKNSKSLLIHSGGDSRRIPMQSLTGKVFAKLPPPENSIFEAIYNFASTIAEQLDDALLMACGDVFLRSENLTFKIPENFDLIGIASLGMPQFGTNHGVYRFDRKSFEVKECLQKASISQLNNLCDETGKVAIDTGLLILRRRAIEQLQNVAKSVPEDRHLNFYGDILPSIATGKIDGLKFGIVAPPELEMHHTGTTRQYFELSGETSEIVKFAVPIGDGFCNIAHGIDELPSECDHQSTIFGEQIYRWLNRHKLDATTIWHEKIDRLDRSLWNAQFYPIEAEKDHRKSYPDWFENPAEKWRKSDRFSMAEIFRNADGVEVFAEAQRSEALDIFKNVVEIVEADRDVDVSPMFREILTPFGYEEIINFFDSSKHKITDNLKSARLQKVMGDLSRTMSEDRKSQEYTARAFEKIRSVMVAKSPSLPPLPTANFWLDRATVRLPARIDLAGAWTDTPPYCLERGGAVLNAAVYLDGKAPIEVKIERLSEPVIRLRSVDGKKSLEITNFSELHRSAKLNDPLALHRVVLANSGIVDLLEGSGLEISSFSALPMGSGLGTSSILALGLVKSIWHLTGISSWSEEQLFNHVLTIEQLLGAGGGWQDQIGGEIDGLKLISTDRGIPQKFKIETLELSEKTLEELSDRLILIDSGQQRIARNILEQVVGDWLSRRKNLVATLDRLGNSAHLMKTALLAGDLEQFGKLLTLNFDGKKILNRNSTNPPIDRLIASILDYSSGYNIAGAGGGGFLVILAKNRSARFELEDRVGKSMLTIKIDRY